MKLFFVFLTGIFAPPNDDEFLEYILQSGQSAHLKSSNVENPCKTGWQYDGRFSCVKIFSPAQTWDNAKRVCEFNEAELVVPKNHLIQDLLLPQLTHSNLWIGVKKITEEGVYKYRNQFTNMHGSMQTFFDWQHGQPSNDSSDNCVKLTNIAGNVNSNMAKNMLHWREINYAPGWSSGNCEEKLSFVCGMESNGTESVCRNGWRDDRNGNCYQLSTVMKTWAAAECTCNKENAHLAVLTDRSYDHLLREIRQWSTKSGIWIGYHRHPTSDGSILWTDRADNVLSYSKWLPSQPKNIGENSCAQLLDAGRYGPFKDTFAYPAAFVPGWVDQNCNAKQYYVCQYHQGLEHADIDIDCSSSASIAVSSLLYSVLLLASFII